MSEYESYIKMEVLETDFEHKQIDQPKDLVFPAASEITSPIKKLIKKDKKVLYALIHGNSVFSNKIIQATRRAHSRNLVYSPLSNGIIIAILLKGAGETTATELIKGMSFPGEASTFLNGYRQIMENCLSLTNQEINLGLSYGIFLPASAKVLNDFKATVKKLECTIDQIDCQTKSQESVNKINEWIMKETKNRIENIVSQEMLNQETSLTLISTAYFHGKWHPRINFEKEFTKKAKFYSSHTKTCLVDMMQLSSIWIEYIDLPSILSHAVCLDYEGGKLTLMIILPKDQRAGLEGLNEVEDLMLIKNITPDTITNNFKIRTKVILKLPKFRIMSSINLKPVLDKMGMKSLFDINRTDFSGISSSDPLTISNFAHKAIIEIDEGSTSTNETLPNPSHWKFVPSSLKPTLNSKPVHFNVDHPFLFQVVDKTTKIILLAGRVYEPNY